MRSALLCLALLLAAAVQVHAAEPQVTLPYERDASLTPLNHIDELVLAALRKRGIEPANLCSDEVFIRRVYLDVIGTLPEPTEVARLPAGRPARQARRADRRACCSGDEFADYWALKWCDLLRVKAEFPINLWPNAVQAYHRWIRDAIRENMPYDQFARELLTSSGSNFRVPPVNFYRAIQGRDPAVHRRGRGPDLHGHAHWQAGRRPGAPDMAAFFSRVAYKKTGEWKEEIVYLDPAADDAAGGRLPRRHRRCTIPPDAGPARGLRRLADRARTIRGSPAASSTASGPGCWAAASSTSRTTSGRTTRPPTPSCSPAWRRSWSTSHYDLRHLYRLILNSRTYQQSSDPAQRAARRPRRCSRYYPVRRLDAEVLIDALCWIGGDGRELLQPHPGAVHLHPGRPADHRAGRRQHHQPVPGDVRPPAARHRPGVRAQQPAHRRAAAVPAQLQRTSSARSSAARGCGELLPTGRRQPGRG